MQQRCFWTSCLEELGMSAEMGSRFRGETRNITFSWKIMNSLSNVKKICSHYDNELSKKVKYYNMIKY